MLRLISEWSHLSRKLSVVLKRKWEFSRLYTSSPRINFFKELIGNEKSAKSNTGKRPFICSFQKKWTRSHPCLTHPFHYIRPCSTNLHRGVAWLLLGRFIIDCKRLCTWVCVCVCLIHPHEHTSTKASIFTLPVENAIALCGGGHTKFKGRWPFTRTRKRRPALTRFVRKLARKLLLVGAKRVERVFYAQRI